MRAVALVVSVMLLALSPAAAQVNTTSPRIYAPNGQYLGNLNSNRHDPNSINNPYGQYGNPYGNTLQNPNSQYGYGNRYSPQSPSYPYGR